MQNVGTEIGRNSDKDIWVKRLLNDIKIFGKDYDYILIDDVRFPNEIELPIEYGFCVKSITVERSCFDNGLTPEQKNHLSETSLDDYKFDYSIKTVEGLDNLLYCINHFYEELIDI